MRRMWFSCFIAVLTVLAAPARAVTLEQAMADPDWIGPPVEEAYWSVDGRSVYYRVKRKGSPVRDLHRVEIASGRDVVVEPAAMADVDAGSPVFDARRDRALFVRNGDVFMRHLGNGRLTQITRTPDRESAAQFSPDGNTVQYRLGNDWYRYDTGRGIGGPEVILKAEADPAAKQPDDYGAEQLRLFSTLRKIKSDRDARKRADEELAKADPTRTAQPFYLGEDVKIEGTSMAPGGRWLLVVTTPKDYKSGRKGKLQRFITDSGYSEQEEERTRVGRNDPAPQTLWLIDVERRQSRKVALDDLPGIGDDPLKAVRDENARWRKEHAAEADAVIARDKDVDAAAERGKKSAKPGEEPSRLRAVRIVSNADDGGGGTIDWSRDGRQVAVQLRAIDNKDRWIATLDFERARLVPQHRLTDPAWINWKFNDLGWTADGQALWYLSEETGYSQLYLKKPGQNAVALTKGAFEVSDPELAPDGRTIYFRANVAAPYRYDVYRVPLTGGEVTRVTRFDGLNKFLLSPDGRQLAVLHSSAYVPAQLAVVGTDGANPRELTDTRTPEYKAIRWIEPQIVAVPSSHTRQPIYAKLYRPATLQAGTKHPAVLFVHGAGYLQNVHSGFPNYYREQMFHNLLVEKGYVVLDMDYRASEGYGRDWRTAIYRNMGHPELEDLIDGVEWLKKNAEADPQRVGLYGGSYGGFMTLMAMFRAPEVFKAGAALRPVTDWISYNHEYTSNILNTPQVDPMAYARSSPIEFAEGLRGGLLIAHGMIDDNVLYEDSVRLFQRLVELRKDDFELAGYPLERHGYVHSDSWYDQYRRILKLFETRLRSDCACR